MDIPKLAAARDCDPETATVSYFSAVSPHDRGTGGDLSTLVTTMFQRTAEAAWPSMLSLGRRLESGEGMQTSRWTFRAEKSAYPWHVAFVAENADGCGFLYVLKLEKERTEASKARGLADLEEARSIEDPAERRAAVSRVLIASIMEENNADDVGDQYEDPRGLTSVDEVGIYAYHGDSPAVFYDGFTTQLPELLADVGAGKYAHGGIADCRPTKDRYGLEPSGSTERCSQTAAVLSALNALYSGLDAAGMMKDVHARAKSVSEWQYPNYGNAANGHAIEAGQGAVYADSGFAGPICFDVAWQFWSEATETDLSLRTSEIHDAIRMLRENGHVSMSSRYDCNDMDDFAHVVMDGRGGFGTLWVGTQNGNYGIRFRENRGGGLSHLVLARVGEGFGVTPLGIDEEEPGFLGAFALAPHPSEDGTRRMSAQKMGRFHDRTVRDINNILLTVESVYCCLEEDRKAARTTATP